jgi:hypothetical protein
MTRINNLDELYAEKQRLTAQLKLQKAIIDDEVRQIKEHLAPVRKVLGFLGIMKKKEDDSPAKALLKTGANIGIDLVGHKILHRAGWISRLVVPLIAKGLSSKLVSRFLEKNRGDNVPQLGDRLRR